MRYLRRLLSGIAIGAMLTSPPASGGDLASYRWKNRLLLLFAPTKTDQGFADFDRSLKQERTEVLDRDLIVFRLFENMPSRICRQPLPPEDAETLRRRFKVDGGRFTVILIGKDGGVKWVREHRAELREVFERIDSMPMRQQEMREKGDRQ